MASLLRILGSAVILLAAGAASADCVPQSALPTVFNASQDLQRVKVRGVQYADLKPNDMNTDSTAGLNAAIDYVIENPNCKQLVLDGGQYSFKSLPKGSPAYIVIKNASNKNFDFHNASFIFEESYFPAFYIYSCGNCSVSNVSIDYIHLPFTQLNVTDVIEPRRAIIAVPQNSGWPNPEQLYQHQAAVAGSHGISLYGFDTRDGIPQYGYTRWAIPHHLPYPHRIPIDSQGVIQKNDVFIVAARGGGPAIRIRNTQNSVLKDVIIHSSAGPGIEAWYSQGISFIGVQIVPASNRLVSTVAGGIEFDAVAGPGNLVQDSVIRGAQDDSIAGNVPAPYAVVESATKNTIALCPGQTLPSSAAFFVNGYSGQMIGNPVNGTEYTLTSNGTGYAVVPAFTADEVRNLPGAVIYNPAQFTVPNYMTVENNQVSNSYLARGIAFSGIGAIRIRNNAITNTQQAGIYVGSALPSNGPVNGAEITGNQLTATNMGMSGVGTGMLGAIEVMSFSIERQTVSGQPSQKISISGNRISQTQRTGIWIANTLNGSVDQNDITGYGQAHGNLGDTPHLNFGLESFASKAFQQEVIGWCTANVSGTTSQKCNRELLTRAAACPESPAAQRNARRAGQFGK